ncbi:Glycogen branching enzyme [Hyphodiscus hymeniophilus]|uniref:Glycogen branching enzyme n=1 Tax=Hyphodiscus hymeniophilus TaxID=353542 RepID=A0A9P7AZ85_9HELO|nr:Glycogen branching enzyme [Hyphodiscus hymeniophilus]
MAFDLLQRRNEKFVLWIPGAAQTHAPLLVLGTFAAGSPAVFNPVCTVSLCNSDLLDLWELDPNSITPPLQNNTIYYYYFEITDTSSSNLGTFLVTDPLAYTVDYRVTNSRDEAVQPAAVIRFRDGKLWPCDIDGNEPPPVLIPTQDAIPDNNKVVIYELPTSWARYKTVGGVQVEAGTFTDVLALFDSTTVGDRFSDIPSIAHEAILADLGTNVLELLPAADAKPLDQWGYATAHYFTPDYDLGSSSDLTKLVEFIHGMNISFFTDVVMAFGHDPYGYIAFDQFHLDPNAEASNPDSYQCHSEGMRNGWGGRLWRYIQNTNGYDPQSGKTVNIHPAWSFHQGHLHRWMSDFGVGGLRLDCVNNIGNYDFLRTYKEAAWSLYRSRYPSASDAKFLVIGEELSVPLDLITGGTLNALWNEPFQGRLRAVILGQNVGDNFEWTVRKMANCTLDSDYPFTDGAQVVNYITSHDTEGTGFGGYQKERLYNFLDDNGVIDVERRAKLAFACFLTAVGIPMIFAGEEFCDQMDLPMSSKQSDPVNYERKAEDWRTRVFNFVASLVNLRKNCPALGGNDTQFIHTDKSRGGKIMAWQRGGQDQAPVVIVANFSDEDTPGDQYFVENWPQRNRNDWREVTQNRNVPSEWVGNEPLMHWEAKVYTYWREI